MTGEEPCTRRRFARGVTDRFLTSTFSNRPAFARHKDHQFPEQGWKGHHLPENFSAEGHVHLVVPGHGETDAGYQILHRRQSVW